jgi:multidrug resistance efflux pump
MTTRTLNHRQLPGQGRLNGGQRRVDPAQLARAEVRAALKAVQEARRHHASRLHAASLGHATDIMATRRALREAERRYRDLTGEDSP